MLLMTSDVRQRYLNDPVFHIIVDSMRGLLRSARLTPSEIREAVMLACIIEEEIRPAPPLTTSDKELEILRQRFHGDQ
jgi:hypothetical protein